ncbi:MAG TPA: efflux RND transporter permease subunit [Anaerolineales bacterium]|nr:efflux RND transporter permease subunit [Anaerolineales bacterium]
MMRSIVGSSMKYQFLVITVAIALMAFGVTQFRGMPVDVLPEFSPPYVEIQTEALGLSAEEVEQMITVPIEQDLMAGVAWLDVIRSESVPGLSSVVIYFEPGTDLYRARQMVTERLAQAAIAIPHVSKPPTMIQPLSSQSRFMIVGLSSQELSLIEMSVLARWTIAPQLMGVPGVAHVAIWGNRDRQLQVLVDPAKLHEQGVSLDQVVDTTGNALWVSSLSYLEASSPGTGGFIDTPNQRLNVWHVLPITSPEELAKVPVDGTEGLRLGDVAQVVEDHQVLIGDAVVNESSNLLLVVEKLPGVNTLEVTRALEAELDGLKPGMPGIQFDATLFRPATFIEMAISNLTRSLVVAALLVVLVLGAFFYGWRAALISMAAILISLFAALFVLYMRGETLNAMVIAGLAVALGLVIDDAIIDVERITQGLRLNRQQGGLRSSAAVILEAIGETRSALFFATVITLLAVVPVFVVQGISGSLFQPVAVSYALAVLAAMVVAVTITPALSLILLSKTNLELRESPFTTRLQGGYERNLSRAVKSPGLANIAIVVLVVAAVIAVPFLKRDTTLPAFREPYLMVRFEAAPGTSHPEMNRIVSRATSELRGISGVSNVGAHVGRAVFGDETGNVNSAELWISIDPKANYDATVASIESVVNGYTGLNREVRTYVQQTLSQPQASASDLSVRLYGEDHEILRAEAQKLQQVLAKVNGVADPRVILTSDEPSLEIEVDLAAAQKFGVKPGDVRRTAAILLSGIQVGSLFEEQKVFDVVVWGEPELRQNITNIHDLLIDVPGTDTETGQQVRLGDVAQVRVVSSPTVIHREAVSPYIDIAFTVEGRSVSAVVPDVNAALRSFPYPLEYHAEVVNDYAARQSAQQSIIISSIVAILGIFLLLQASFRSWQLALVSIITLPAALAGAILADLLGNGGEISLGLIMGALAVAGIFLRNSMMLVSHYQYLEEQGGESFGADLVMRGARERMSPTLMTALATGLAFLPFILFGNVPGHEIIRPMALVVIGGLVTSTWFNLFAMPALYLRFGASREADLGFQQATAIAADD